MNEMNEKPTHYICSGSVGGWCGTQHRTLGAAYRHLGREQRALSSLSRPGSLSRSYSDKDVYAVYPDGHREIRVEGIDDEEDY